MNGNEITIKEVADHLTKATQGEKEALAEFGFLFPDHLIVAHAKRLTGKWFRWRLTRCDRQRATIDLMRRYKAR